MWSCGALNIYARKLALKCGTSAIPTSWRCWQVELWSAASAMAIQKIFFLCWTTGGQADFNKVMKFKKTINKQGFDMENGNVEDNIAAMKKMIGTMKPN